MSQRTMDTWLECPTGTGGRLFGRLWQPSGTPRRVVVIVHGLGEHGGRYAEVATRLVDADSAVLAFDHHGHGRSPGRRGCVPSYHAVLADIDAALGDMRRRFPDAEQVLLGHSMGGNFSASFALRHPDALDRLVLSGALLLPAQPPNRQQIFAASLTGKLFPWLRINAPVRPDQLTRDATEATAFENDPLRHTKLSLYLATQLLAQGRRTLDQAIDLRVPTLCLHGEADPLCDVEACRAFASRAPRGRVTLRCYPGMLHEIFKEIGRQQVFDDLVTWLAKPAIRLATGGYDDDASKTDVSPS